MTGLGSGIYYLEFLQDLHYLLIDKFQAANNDINLLSESHALLQLLPKKDPATDTRLEKLDARLKDLHAKSELIQKQIEACRYAALIPHHKDSFQDIDVETIILALKQLLQHLCYKPEWNKAPLNESTLPVALPLLQ